MLAASILSLSKPAISTCQPASGAARHHWNGNVCLPNSRGKFHDTFYNPLQSKEFRVNYMICRLIGGPPGLQQPLELAQRIRARQKGTHGAHRAQSLERRLRSHFKVYEPTRGAHQEHIGGVPHPTPAGRYHHVADQLELGRQLMLLLAKIRLALLTKDLADRPTFAALDLRVEIEKRATEPFGHGLTDRRLPRTGKTDEDQVRPRGVSRRAGSRGAKDRRHSFVAFRRASRLRTSRERRRPTRTRACLQR